MKIIFLKLFILLWWLLPWSFNQIKIPFTFHFRCWSKFAFILSLDIYGSVQVMWGTLTASLLGLLLKSLSQESICNRFPFYLSPPSVAVEHIEKKPRCTSCVWVTSCSALVPRRNEMGTKVLTCTMRSVYPKLWWQLLCGQPVWRRSWRKVKGWEAEESRQGSRNV